MFNATDWILQEDVFSKANAEKAHDKVAMMYEVVDGQVVVEKSG